MGYESACWLFADGGSHDRYGMVRNRPAHVVSYEHFYGAVPSDHVVHHKCRVKRCIRPEHLQALTPTAHAKAHGLGGKTRGSTGKKCLPGCTCGKHRPWIRVSQKCPPGCACRRHNNPVLAENAAKRWANATPEERAAKGAQMRKAKKHPTSSSRL